jgi:phage-related protein
MIYKEFLSKGYKVAFGCKILEYEKEYKALVLLLDFIEQTYPLNDIVPEIQVKLFQERINETRKVLETLYNKENPTIFEQELRNVVKYLFLDESQIKLDITFNTK